ncbi:MAG: aminotransferase class V-fold PLP-dependent enzyme [Actinobacteria bacterium]|nr:MAG: aminotransferase class V-fold PLP-dependent enzyme [Actinomycetota bacterium]
MAHDTFIYLDNAATSYPKPEVVYEFMIAFYRKFGVNPGRSGYDLCIEAGQVVEQTRRLLTGLFNGSDWTRLVFGYNSTDALNLALFGLLREGDHAISTTIEHNSVLRPLWHLQRDHGVAVDLVPFDAKGFVDPDAIKARFRPNTKVVAVNHGSNVVGTIQPVAEIGRLCRERGITLVVDSSQTAGKIPIDVVAMNIDVLCFTGHKSLLGPTGIGGMYVREGVEIRHTRAGGTGVKSATREHLAEYPYRMEYGTGNTLGIAGLNAGVNWVLQKGIQAIDEHEMALTRQLRDGLAAIEGVTLYCQDDLANHIGVIAFNLDGLEAGETGTLLDVDHGIACRTGLHCAPLVHEQIGTDAVKGAVRFGVGPFNTEDEIAHAVEAVREIARSRRKRLAAV